MTSMTSDELNIEQEVCDLSQLVKNILLEAKSSGATSAEVGVSKQIGLSANVRNKEVETIEFNRDCGFGITVYIGQRKGNASTSDTNPQAIESAVNAAISIANQTTEDPFAGLVDESSLAKNIKDLELDHPMGITPEAAIEYALEAETAIYETDPRIKSSDGTTFASHRGIRLYGNSNGFLAGYPTTRHAISAVAIAEDQQGMQRDYYYSVARNQANLLSNSIVGQKAAERTVNRLGARPIKTGTYPVILSPEVAAGFFGHIIGAISGGALYRKSSFLVDTLGQRLFPESINIKEQPFILQGMGSSPFDADGLETREQHFVRDGILESYVLSHYSAKRLGMSSTANAGGVHNLVITDHSNSAHTNSGHSKKATDEKTLNDLIQTMQTGLLITEVMGQGVNIVTGDYSRGASGFWIENGEIQHPVEEITIASNLKFMMKSIQSIGDDRDPRLSTQIGSVLIESMTVAG